MEWLLSKFKKGVFEIEQAIIPYLIFMHAVEYGITEIQNSAGHLKKKKKTTNNTLIHLLGEHGVNGLIENSLDSDPRSI